MANGINQNLAPTCLVSVNRIVQLPVVETTIQMATNVYVKVKRINRLTYWTCSTAENVVNKAVAVGKPIAVPVVIKLDRPIKTIDGLLCSGLDYVENKVPSVKLPPKEMVTQMYHTTKDYVNKNITPKMESVYAYVEPSVLSAYEQCEPCVKTAKTIVEPALERVKPVMEPLIQPALDTVEAVKNFLQEEIVDDMERYESELSKGVLDQIDEESFEEEDKVESEHY